jgi:DNA mismatch repair protein MutS2
MRLSNPKTKVETGFDYVVHSINVITPFGKKVVKELTPYAPGEEDQLISALNQLEQTMDFIRSQTSKVELLLEVFQKMYDNTFTIERSKNSVLSMVELFEMKTLLLQMRWIREMQRSLTCPLPEEFLLDDVDCVLDILDPSRERINTFYLYDTFSKRLSDLREEKRSIEIEVRKEQKELRRKVEGTYGISMTPKFLYLVSKADKGLLERAATIPELSLYAEDYMTTTFTLKSSPAVHELRKRLEEMNEAIEEEELSVRERLSSEIGSHRQLLQDTCTKIGIFDFAIAKAFYAGQNHCVKPEITKEHVLEIQDGRFLMVEEVLRRKGKNYCPVTLMLEDGVTCITGANMGGKTVTLKMAGMCAMLAQHGFFVPCGRAKIGLSNYIHILIGDSQNVQRGLSSFGSEMEELKDILDHSKERTLLLIDEIASGTNPLEGLALTKSLVHYFSERPYITLITTHYDHVANAGEIRNMQVRGLAGANFEHLAREIRYANRKERIEIIGKYMDYRLDLVIEDPKIPKDALNIAQMLGINNEIIEQAKTYMEDRKDEK